MNKEGVNCFTVYVGAIIGEHGRGWPWALTNEQGVMVNLLSHKLFKKTG